MRVINNLVLLGLIWAAAVLPAGSQIVNFHAIAGDGIQIQLPQPESLNFGQFLKGTETVTSITLMDEGAVCFEVTAPSQYDVTVWMDFPANLVSDSDPLSTLPASFRFAYNNKAFPSKSCGNALTKSMAIEVPDGFSSATFPVSFRNSGQPLPPPTPDHVGYTGPTDSFFILIYGQAGPAANDIVSGIYNGDIVLNIQFSTTD